MGDLMETTARSDADQLEVARDLIECLLRMCDDDKRAMDDERASRLICEWAVAALPPPTDSVMRRVSDVSRLSLAQNLIQRLLELCTWQTNEEAVRLLDAWNAGNDPDDALPQ
jgi:hypothetical protein